MTVDQRAMKFGTHIQVPNMKTPARFQGHSLIITRLSLTCLVFRVIEPQCKQCKEYAFEHFFLPEYSSNSAN